MAVGRTNSIGFNTAEATATANDILYGKTAYAGNTLVTGTIVTKTSNDLTASGATVTVPAGYYASQATKSVATTTHPNPTASVNSSTGVVTASHTQTAGYVSAGTTTGTLQLTVQAAATITPGTSNKTAVAAGRYTTGAVTVAGDADLTAANIKNGVNIFGVAGTFTYATAASAAGAGHILKDKVAFVNGSQVTGTIVTKTASDLTASGAVVTVPAGYYASQVTKSVGTTSHPNPTATINTSTGLVTVSHTQTVGYVTAGTTTGTLQLTTKAAATITPGTSNQTIAAGTYLTGAQTIAGNANLVAGNIKSGVSIFGVTGSYSGSGSGTFNIGSSSTFIGAYECYPSYSSVNGLSSETTDYLVWFPNDGRYLLHTIQFDGLARNLSSSATSSTRISFIETFYQVLYTHSNVTPSIEGSRQLTWAITHRISGSTASEVNLATGTGSGYNGTSTHIVDIVTQGTYTSQQVLNILELHSSGAHSFIIKPLVPYSAHWELYYLG